MKKYFIKTSFMLLAVLVFGTYALAQESYHLQYKFTKGKNLTYKSQTSTDMTQEVMGREMKVNSEVNLLTSTSVENVDQEGTAAIIASLDSATIHSVMMGRDTTYTPAAMLGIKTKFNCTKYGNTSSMELLDSASDNNRMALQFSQGGKSMFIHMPASDIKVGDNWTSSEVDTIKNFGGKILNTADYTYTLAGKEEKMGHNCYKIPFTSTNKIEGSGNMQGMELYIEGSGKSSGTVYINVDDGMIVYMENDLNSDLTMATTGQQKMIIPITQSTKTTVSLVSE